MFARKKAKRRERLEFWLVVVVGAACASAGNGHGVVRGSDNRIQAEGAVALAAALQGNTTLQTLDLCGMCTARCVSLAGCMGGHSVGISRVRGPGGASGWWLWLARRARVRAVRTAWSVVQGTESKPRALLRWRRR
jgi:hypothetical protein